LRSVLGNAAVLEPFSDDESRDVLQEYQRDVSLRTELNEVGCLERAFGKQYPIVPDDPDRVSPNPSEAADDCRPVQCFEFVKPACIHNAVDHLANVVHLPRIRGNDFVDLFRILLWIFTVGYLAGLLARYGY